MLFRSRQPRGDGRSGGSRLRAGLVDDHAGRCVNAPRQQRLRFQRGASVGFTFGLGKRSRIWNTFDAHRLLHHAGLISPEQAAYSHQKNLVTRAMGVEDIVLLEIHSHAVHPGDWYLLCSDGLSDMLDDARIAAVLREQGSDVGKAAQALVDAANQAGGRDNIAVILVAVHAVPSSGQPWWPFRR